MCLSLEINVKENKTGVGNRGGKRGLDFSPWKSNPFNLMHRYRQNIGTVAQLNLMPNEVTWNVAGHLARIRINPYA